MNAKDKYRKAHKEELRLKRIEYYKTHKDKTLDRCKKYYYEHWEEIKLKRYQRYHNNPKEAIAYRYKITLEQLDTLIKESMGRCAVCDKELKGLGLKGMCIDHSHENGKIRGILCNMCNMGLGKFNDNIKLLESAIKYLKERN